MVKRKHQKITLHLHNKMAALKDVHVETSVEPDMAFSRKKLHDFYNSAIKAVINLKDDDTNEYITGPFVQLPPKKQYPDYYDIIEHPISLKEIKTKTNLRKTRSANFPTLYEFIQMFKLMANNAKAYNGADSLLAKDSNHIYSFVKGKAEKFANTQPKRSISPRAIKTEQEEEEQQQQQQQQQQQAEQSQSKEKGFDGSIQAHEKSAQAMPVSGVQDYSENLSKFLQEIIDYKETDEQTSLILSIPFMDPVDGKMYPDYYKIVKKGMCLNQVSKNLANGLYKDGTDGIEKFNKDMDLIFKNACTYNAKGSEIYRDAMILKKMLDERIVNFKIDSLGLPIVKKRGRGRPPLKPTQIKQEKVKEQDEIRKRVGSELPIPEPKKPKKRGRKSKKQKLIEAQMEEERIREEKEERRKAAERDLAQLREAVGAGNASSEQGATSFIRKHDIEKADKVEAVDDITAFIKRFTISSAIKQYSTYSSDVMRYFEHCMIEPAGNSTIGGSTYSITLPAEVVLGQPLIVLVSLQNRIIDEKYTTVLKVNEELLKPQPLTISYDEDDDDGEFVACKFEFKLGLGLNLFEFQLRVPFPLKEKKTEEEKARDLVARAAADAESGMVTRSAAREEEEQDGSHNNEETPSVNIEDQKQFRESVKLWVKVA